MYAIYHGKDNLINISKDIAIKSLFLKEIIGGKYEVENVDTYGSFFVKLNNFEKNEIFDKLLKNNIELRKLEEGLIISVNETTNLNILNNVLEAFRIYLKENRIKEIINNYTLNDSFKRNPGSFLNQNIFKKTKSETDMLRYINSLADKDYSLVHGMIPLGSCTET